jgi:hypothetical protein
VPFLLLLTSGVDRFTRGLRFVTILLLVVPYLRRGLGTSSPPQLGQMECMALAHWAQKVHS